MGTRSVVAVPTGPDAFRGRYIHWDGSPSGVGVALLAIVSRDGYTTAVRTLTEEHTRWSSVNGEGGHLSRISGDVDPYGVDGYGSAPDDEDATYGWVTSDGDDWGTEWAYVLGESGITVWERVYGATAEWKQRGTVRYGDTETMAALDA